MLKKHFTVLLLLVIMTFGAFAQSIPSGTARYEALGYNPFIMDAATDINRNPAWGGMYKNYGFGDLGRATGNGSDFYLDDQYVGINFGLGKTINAGLILNKNKGMIFGGLFGADGSYNTFDISNPIVPLEVLLGYSSPNKKLHIGLAPYYAAWSKDSTVGGVLTERSSSTLGGTLGVISIMKNGWIEGNVDFRMNSFKFADTSVTYKNDGGMELGVALRAFLMVNKQYKINLVPYGAFNMVSWKPNYTPVDPTAHEYKWSGFAFGVGMNMPVLDNGLLAGGLSFALNSYEDAATANDPETGNTYNYKLTQMSLPQFNFGLEWGFADWFTGRAGYSRAVINQKTTFTLTSGGTSTTSELKEMLASNPDQTITLGAGFHFNRFSIEGTIGEKFFQRGPYILSGRGTDMFGVLSASYNFNK
jgi:hypothetical protein